MELELGDVVEVRLIGTLFGQTTINTFHYSISSGTPAPGDMDQLLNSFNGIMWEEGIATVVSQDLQDVRIEGQVIYPVRGLVEFVYAEPTAGAVATPAAPPTVTVSLRRRTAVAGRKYRGRIFVPGVPTASILGGQLTNADVDDWDGIALLMATPLSVLAHTAQPIIWSVAEQVSRGPIVSGDADQVLRSQRRREVGKGI